MWIRMKGQGVAVLAKGCSSTCMEWQRLAAGCRASQACRVHFAAQRRELFSQSFSFRISFCSLWVTPEMSPCSPVV